MTVGWSCQHVFLSLIIFCLHHISKNICAELFQGPSSEADGPILLVACHHTNQELWLHVADDLFVQYKLELNICKTLQRKAGFTGTFSNFSPSRVESERASRLKELSWDDGGGRAPASLVVLYRSPEGRHSRACLLKRVAEAVWPSPSHTCKSRCAVDSAPVWLLPPWTCRFWPR